jgi:hypothetical protein
MVRLFGYHRSFVSKSNSGTDSGHVKRQRLKEAIDEMISGKEVTVNTSRSVGCSIKNFDNVILERFFDCSNFVFPI